MCRVSRAHDERMGEGLCLLRMGTTMLRSDSDDEGSSVVCYLMLRFYVTVMCGEVVVGIWGLCGYFTVERCPCWQ